MIFKQIPFFYDKKRRTKFFSNEIFFFTCSILRQSRFTSNFKYFLFKRRMTHTFLSTIRNRCVLTGYSKSVNSRLKISRRAFLRKVNFSMLPGIYRSL